MAGSSLLVCQYLEVPGHEVGDLTRLRIVDVPQPANATCAGKPKKGHTNNE